MILTLFFAIACAPDPAYSPTPVVMHDASSSTDVAGYALTVRDADSIGPALRIANWPCWWDVDDDGVPVVRYCRAVDVGAPLQRYCDSCVPLRLYEYSVLAYDDAGNYSVNNPTITVCAPLLMEITP
jgi:hypothetical protein